MLSEILKLFIDNQTGWCVDELAIELGEDPERIAVMLEHLVRMGRLQRETGWTGCSTCRAKHSCALVNLRRPVYTLSSPNLHLSPVEAPA